MAKDERLRIGAIRSVTTDCLHRAALQRASPSWRQQKPNIMARCIPSILLLSSYTTGDVRTCVCMVRTACWLDGPQCFSSSLPRAPKYKQKMWSALGTIAHSWSESQPLSSTLRTGSTHACIYRSTQDHSQTENPRLKRRKYHVPLTSSDTISKNPNLLAVAGCGIRSLRWYPH